MKGGAGKIIPMYQPKNDPNLTNMQKKINNDRNFENKKYPAPPAPDQKPMIDLQVYQPQQQTAPKPRVDPAMFIPIHGGTIGYPPQWFPQYQYKPNNVPILKNYNINVSGPTVDHSTINTVYEDSLPSKELITTATTIGERNNMYSFVRSIFVRTGDGEDIDIDGKGENSLLRYLKFIELNPYNPNQMSNNPYKGLPDNMLIYRSCYPIRYDMNNNTTTCAKNPLGMNIRIYRMTYGEYYINQTGNDKGEYDLWREISYYEFIRESILKNKICPNFPFMYCYFISEKCDIDFNKLLIAKGKGANVNPRFAVKTENKPDFFKNTFSSHLHPPFMNFPPLQTGGDCGIYNNSRQPINITEPPTPDMNDYYPGKALVALTEAPNYNLNAWATKTYRVNGSIRTMVNTGYYKSDVWKSVLFQLLVGMYTMQLNNIAFRDFTLIDNVYIKDIQVHENSNNFWKYIIDGVEYFIPNHGYLVILDSNYKDNNNGYKIMGEIFGDDKDIVYDMNFENFKNAFNPNNFSNAFTSAGGTKPPEDVLELINNIYINSSNSNADTDIGTYIIKFMRSFMNNRIGSLLTTSEIKSIRKNETREFKQGNIFIHEFMYDTYKFVMYVGDNNDDNALILSKDDPNDSDTILMTVPKSSLYNYSKYSPLKQIYKSKTIFNDENLLETYVVDK